MNSARRHVLVVGASGPLLDSVLQILRNAQCFFDVRHDADSALSLLSGIRFPTVVLVSEGPPPVDQQRADIDLHLEDLLPPEFETLVRRLADAPSSPRVLHVSSEREDLASVLSRALATGP